MDEWEKLADLGDVHSKIAKEAFGPVTFVYCHTCDRRQAVDPASCLKMGWPKCCSGTMSLDKPEQGKARPLVGGRRNTF